MRIGNQDNAFTAIATSDEHTITVRGHDLVGDLIGQIDFTDYFWLLVCGQRPTEVQKAMMNACLVAIAEHGLVPSVQAARMTLAAAPEAWQGAMAAGLLGMGTVVAGSTEVAGRFLAEVVADGGDVKDGGFRGRHLTEGQFQVQRFGERDGGGQAGVFEQGLAGEHL